MRSRGVLDQSAGRRAECVHRVRLRRILRAALLPVPGKLRQQHRGIRRAGNGFTKDYFRVDASVRQKLPVPGLQVFLDINNINNRKNESAQASMNGFTSQQYYGRRPIWGCPLHHAVTNILETTVNQNHIRRCTMKKFAWVVLLVLVAFPPSLWRRPIRWTSSICSMLAAGKGH